jgi:superoxide reductase
MERRDFIRLSIASAGATLLTSTLSQAEASPSIPPAADIYFTKDAPGRWAGKEKTHTPIIEISKSADTVDIKVTTPHEMKGYEHYIVKHVLLDKDFKFLQEHLLDPSKDPVPISNFTLKNYSGNVYALSFCNKHDLWLSSAEV